MQMTNKVIPHCNITLRQRMLSFKVQSLIQKFSLGEETLALEGGAIYFEKK